MSRRSYKRIIKEINNIVINETLAKSIFSIIENTDSRFSDKTLKKINTYIVSNIKEIIKKDYCNQLYTLFKKEPKLCILFIHLFSRIFFGGIYVFFTNVCSQHFDFLFEFDKDVLLICKFIKENINLVPINTCIILSFYSKYIKESNCINITSFTYNLISKIKITENTTKRDIYTEISKYDGGRYPSKYLEEIVEIVIKKEFLYNKNKSNVKTFLYHESNLSNLYRSQKNKITYFSLLPPEIIDIIITFF